MTEARLFEKLDAEVTRWNRDVPIGTNVRLRYSQLPRRTTTAAFIHAKTPFVYVSGYTVAIPLEDVQPC